MNKASIKSKDIYFAIIGNHTKEVTGVCTGESLLDVCKEDHCPDFVEITKEQFDDFGDNGIVLSENLKRYTSKIVMRVKLTPIRASRPKHT